MDREFCIDYILDDCLDCPELSDGKSCITKSNCFKVKEKIIADLRKLDKIEQIISERDELDSKNCVCGNRALMDLSKIKEVINSDVGTD